MVEQRSEALREGPASKWIAPADIDQEMIPLCGALNELPGIATTTSCFGHGETPLYLWFHCASMKSLAHIAWARRMAAPTWLIEALDYQGDALFVMTSPTPVERHTVERMADVLRSSTKHHKPT